MGYTWGTLTGGLAVKVKNETRYDTRQLRSLFLWCLRKEGISPAGYYVMVDYARSQVQGWIGGRGWYHARRVGLFLPGRTQGQWCYGSRLADASRIACSGTEGAQVFIHELHHNQGLHHADMICSLEIDVSGLPARLRWLRLLPPKQARHVDQVAVRYQRAQAGLDRWTRKLKAAQNKVKAYKRKVGYYQRTYAARLAACKPQEEP